MRSTIDEDNKEPAKGAVSNGADHDPLAAAAAAMRLAEDLLLPSPDALSMNGEQLVIPVIKRPSDTEFFRTHPTMRLTVAMITINKGTINSQDYAVPRTAVGLVAQTMGADILRSACIFHVLRVSPELVVWITVPRMVAVPA